MACNHATIIIINHELLIVNLLHIWFELTYFVPHLVWKEVSLQQLVVNPYSLHDFPDHLLARKYVKDIYNIISFTVHIIGYLR